MEPGLMIGSLREIWQQTGDLHWLPVQGYSMLPLLRDGDSILVTHDLSNMRKGDILVFQRADGLVAHRLIQVVKHSGNSPVYLTKGDNCTYFDAPLAGKDILGRVNSVRKDGRTYDFTAARWQVWNSFLASCHFLVGTFCSLFRQIKK